MELKKEAREDHQDLVNIIKNEGPLDQIIQNENIIRKILAYNGDRNLTNIFFRMIADGIRFGEISEEDLVFLRTGRLTDLIIGLEEFVKKQANRDLYAFEISDKINYMQLLGDPETLIKVYTHPALMKAIAKGFPKELTYWFTNESFRNLPYQGQIIIAQTQMRYGNYLNVNKILEAISTRMKQEKEITQEQEEKNRVY